MQGSEAVGNILKDASLRSLLLGRKIHPQRKLKSLTLAEEKLHDDFVIPDDLQSLVVSDISVFIDPLDGTREFVERRLEAVTSLVGVYYRGQAVAGIIGLPFHCHRP